MYNALQRKWSLPIGRYYCCMLLENKVRITENRIGYLANMDDALGSEYGFHLS